MNVIESGDVRYHEKRHEVKNAWASFEKSVRLLNYKNNTPLEKGLRDMWKWAQVQPDRPRQSWDEYEVEEKIYDFWKNK
jgi:UDP-glucose 4-epimerase